MIWVHFQGKPFNTTVIQVYAPTTNAEQGEVDHFYEDLQDLLVCLVTQSCLTLCDPMDCSPPGGSLHGIFQARTLEWVSNSYSRGSCQTQGSNTRLFTTMPSGKPLCFRYCFMIMIFQRGFFLSSA